MRLWLLVLLWAATAFGLRIVSQSQVRESFDNKATLVNHVGFTCSNLDPSGIESIDSATIGVQCRPPEFRFVKQLIGYIPRDVRLETQFFCIANNPTAVNATHTLKNAAVAEGSPFRRRLLSVNDVGDGVDIRHYMRELAENEVARQRIMDYFHKTAGAMQRKLLYSHLDDMQNFLKGQGGNQNNGACGGDRTTGGAIGDFFDPSHTRLTAQVACLTKIYGDFQEYKQDFNQLTTQVGDAIKNQTKWNNATTFEIQQLVGTNKLTAASLSTLAQNATTAAYNINQTVYLLSAFMNDTQTRFERVRDNITTLQTNVNNEFVVIGTEIGDLDYKYHNITNSLYDTDQHILDIMSDGVTRLTTRIEDLAQTMGDQIDLLWANAKNSFTDNKLSDMFWPAIASVVAENRIPAVGHDSILPLRIGEEFSEANRLTYERIHVNFLRNVSCAGGLRCAQLESYAITFYGGRDQLILAAAHQYDLLRLMHMLGPALCQRPVVKLRSGDYVNETSTGLFSVPCLMYIEVERTYCPMTPTQEDEFEWRSAEQSFDPRSQTTLFRTGYCQNIGSVVTPESVPFRDFASYRQYFRDQICRAELWVDPTSTAGQTAEFQMAALVFGDIFYVNQQVGICGHDMFVQIAESEPDLEGIIYGILQSSNNNNNFNYQLNKARLDTYGARPSGIHYTTLPFVHIPPPIVVEDADVATYADSVVDRCTYMEWVSMPRETLPVYSLTPLVGNFELSSITADVNVTYQQEYQFEVEVTQSGSSQYSSFLDTSYIVVGELGDQVGPVYVYNTEAYDIPESQLNVRGTATARRNSVAYWLFPLINSTLTEDVYLTFSKLNNYFVEPQYGGESASSYIFDLVLGPDGFPYCALANDAGAVINSSRQIRTATSNPSGKWCNMMRYFQLDEIETFAAGTDIIRARPRQWEMNGEMKFGSGLFENLAGISNCTDTQLSRLGTAGWNIRLENGGFQIVEQRIVVDGADSSVCDVDEVVRVPAASHLDVTIGACSRSFVNVYRRTNSTGIWAPCISYNLSDVSQLVDTATSQVSVDTTIVIAADAEYARQAILARNTATLLLDLVLTLANFTTNVDDETQLIAIRQHEWSPTAVPDDFQMINFTDIGQDNSGLYQQIKALLAKVGDDAASTAAAALTVQQNADQINAIDDAITASVNKNILLNQLIANLGTAIGNIKIKGNGWSLGERSYSRLMSPGYADWTSWSSLFYDSPLRCFDGNYFTWSSFFSFNFILHPIDTAADAIVNLIETIVLVPFRLVLWVITGPVIILVTLMGCFSCCCNLNCCGKVLSCCSDRCGKCGSCCKKEALQSPFRYAAGVVAPPGGPVGVGYIGRYDDDDDVPTRPAPPAVVRYGPVKNSDSDTE